MANKKHLHENNKNRDKQNSVFAGRTLNQPKNSEAIQISSFDKYQVLFLVFLVLVGITINFNTLYSPFVFDDRTAIMENPSIRMKEITAKSIIDAATGYGKNRPVTMLSFGLNYYFGEYNVFGYHLINIIIHIINGILLFFLLKLTLTLYNRQSNSTPKFDQITIVSISFFTSILWLAHPAQTQSVTYIVQRMNSMGAMFFILALFLYAKGRVAQRMVRGKAENASKPYLWWFAGCFLAALLALGSKESTALLPFFIFLYEWYFFQDLSGDWLKNNIKYFLIILGAFAFVGFIYLGSSPIEKLSSISDYADKQFTLSERFMTQFRVVVYYLSLIIYPKPSRLNLDYDFPLSYSLIHPVTTLLSLIFIIGLTISAVLLAKRQRLISFSIWWFLGNLVIESSVIPLAIIFEHRVYLPSMLVWLVPVVLLHRYFKPRLLTIGICCVLAALFAHWTFERNKVWRDDVTLWADCVKKSPNKARPYLNLGEALTNQKRYDEALTNLLKAIQIDPNYSEARLNLGFLYQKQGNINEAIEQYHKAIQIDPNFAKAYINLGAVLTDQGQTEDAISSLQKALQINHDLPEAHMNLGVALAAQNSNAAAIEHFKKGLQLSPDLPRARFLLGNALLKIGQTEQGIHLIETALQIDPDYADAHNNLGGELLRQGKIDEALKHFNAALKINPDIAEAHNNVGIIMIQKGNLDAAISHFQEALRIAPDFEMARKNLQRALAIRQKTMDPEFRRLMAALENRPEDPVLNYRLGNLYLNRGELNNAVQHFEKALARQPKFPEAQNNLALAYAAGRQYDQALAAFKKLLELDPDNSSTCYNIAVLYALQNKVDDAVGWLKKAVDLGYRNWELIKTDKDLANIRHSAGYQQLVEGH